MRRTISLFFLLVFVAGIFTGAWVVSYLMNNLGVSENTDTLRIENKALYSQSLKIITEGKEYIIKIDKKEKIQIKAKFKKNLQVFLLPIDYNIGEETEFLILDVDFVANKINIVKGKEKYIKVEFTQN